MTNVLRCSDIEETLMLRSKTNVLLTVMGLACSTAVGLYLLPGSAAKAEPTAGKPDPKRAVVKKESNVADTVYEFTAKTLDGQDKSLSDYRGKVLLIVNTASKCGFTPQYEGLEKLYKDNKSKGFEILGFPCNQFGAQEPGDAAEIGAFCKKNYGVDFQMFEKVDVNGEKAHPLWKFLQSEKRGAFNTESIKWNFTKFLVDRNGVVQKRYAPNVKPEDIAADIKKLVDK